MHLNKMLCKLNAETKHITNLTKNDILVGKHPDNNNEIYSTIGKYGLCIKIMDKDKWRYAPVKEVKQDDITLELAVKLLEYPKLVGKIGNETITLNKGKFGLYFKKGNMKASVKDEDRCMDLSYAKHLFTGNDPYAIKTFKINDKVINLKNGPYGYYLQVKSNNKKPKNIALNKKLDTNEVDIELIKKLVK